MDYFQGVLTDYLRADLAMFVNTECCIQLSPGTNPDRTGHHWYCDAIAVNFRTTEIFLCEVSYEKSLSALVTRLNSWSEYWPQLKVALVRDCKLPLDWPVCPWLFVPHDLRSTLEQKLNKLSNPGFDNVKMPTPKLTELEDILPWKYKSWNRIEEDANEDTYPPKIIV